MALRIGLTGGIGSGKSTVAKIFETLGIPVFYADAAARRVMNEDEELKKKIKETFGDVAYSNGILNRKYIADIVFNDPFKLEQLNALVHPATIAMAEKWMQQQTTSYTIKEAALFFEAGTTEGLDYIICVYAPEDLRDLHAMPTHRVTQIERRRRLKQQMQLGILLGAT